MKLFRRTLENNMLGKKRFCTEIPISTGYVTNFGLAVILISSMTTEQPPPCTLRRSDGKPNHDHWNRSEYKNLVSSPGCPKYSYHGACHCKAILFEFGSSSQVDGNSTFYVCDCNACFKRGYIFYVIPMRNFQFTTCSAADLGTYATATG